MSGSRLFPTRFLPTVILRVSGTEGGGMAEYRVYQIKDNRVAAPPTVIEADADPAAIEQARLLVNGCDMELWEGPRFVISLGSADN